MSHTNTWQMHFLILLFNTDTMFDTNTWQMHFLILLFNTDTMSHTNTWQMHFLISLLNTDTMSISDCLLIVAPHTSTSTKCKTHLRLVPHSLSHSTESRLSNLAHSHTPTHTHTRIHSAICITFTSSCWASKSQMVYLRLGRFLVMCLLYSSLTKSSGLKEKKKSHILGWHTYNPQTKHTDTHNPPPTHTHTPPNTHTHLWLIHTHHNLCHAHAHTPLSRTHMNIHSTHSWWN